MAGARGAPARTTNNVIPIEAAFTQGGETNPEPLAIASGEPSAETRMIEAGDQALLYQALDAVTPLFREVLVLREIEDMSYAEIATVLGVPQGTVMSRLSRARAELRLRYKDVVQETGQSCGVRRSRIWRAPGWTTNCPSHEPTLSPTTRRIARPATHTFQTYAFWRSKWRDWDVNRLRRVWQTGSACRLPLSKAPTAPPASVVPFARPRRWQGFVQQFASMAAVCLLSVFGTWAVMNHPVSVPETKHDVVAAHVRSLLQNNTIQVVSSDSHTVRPWFNGKVEFAPPVKDLAAEGFPLYGGRLDYVDGHRVATLVYHHGPHTISVFVWPEASASSAPPVLTQAEGLNVLSWTKDGMVWWAVSDMDQSEMKELRALL